MITYPKLEEMYYEKQKEKILNSWLETIGKLDSLSEEENFNEEFKQVNLKNPVDHNKLEEKKARETYIKENTEGILKIEKIKLYQPVLKGITEKNLNISLASIENTCKLGEMGNYCIAGHRSRTYGRNFNRLDELALGDLIEMITDNHIYQFEIFEKVLVKADETGLLKSNNTEQLITLITCDYSQKPSLRLIIRGRLLDRGNIAEKDV